MTPSKPYDPPAPLHSAAAPPGDLPSVTIMDVIELYDTLIDET